MHKTANYLVIALSACLMSAGCSSSGDTADTAPPKPVDLQTRINSVENSNMTPEQKTAAIDYIKQGEARSKVAKAASGAASGPPAN